MPNAKSPGDVEQLHADWHELVERLRSRELLLSLTLATYARGEGPRPDQLMAEVLELRAECSRRFKAMLGALRDCPP